MPFPGRFNADVWPSRRGRRAQALGFGSQVVRDVFVGHSMLQTHTGLKDKDMILSMVTGNPHD
jgi:hypothetical protein